MKRNLLIAFLFIFSGSYSQWIPQTAPAGVANLYSVFAIDSNGVAASGFQRLVRTLDGGNVWTSNVTVTNVNFFEVHTADPARWFSLSQNSTWMIKIGNPGGVTLQSGKPDSILSLHFTSPACGVAVGVAGKIETTCDSGITWQLTSSGLTTNLNAVWFADSDTGVACGFFGGVTRTTNGGATWTPVTISGVQVLNAIHFPTPQVGYIAGNFGLILKSVDAGATWNALTTGITYNFNGIFFNNPDTGYVVGAGGNILRTVNGGTNWSPMISGTLETLNSVHFVSPEIGWVVGNNATILKYAGFSTGMVSENLNGEIKVFPNPAKENIFVERNFSSSAATIELLDCTGRKIEETIISSGEKNATINVTHLVSGIYFVRMMDVKSPVTKKVVVQH